MSHARPHDEWLLPALAALLPGSEIERLRALAPESLWAEAVRGGAVTDEDLVHALARRFRMNVADLDALQADARALVPEALARRYAVVPLSATEHTLLVAGSNPNDLDCERALAFATGRSVELALASPSAVADGIEELYGPASVAEWMAQCTAAGFGELLPARQALSPVTAEASDRGAARPVTRLVDLIVAEGIAARASDIHIDAEENAVTVRYRIDGVLRQVMMLPRAVGVPLVSRVKIMSGLDIADRLRPQDGRARVVVKHAPVDLRVSTLPAAHGEKIVVRILDSHGSVLSLDRMGLHPGELSQLDALLAAREGFVLVTGPTGSGKTTTLYSALGRVQARGVNVITVEDPVEYRMPGVVQVQVHERAGLTFASALRAILRQDPDVVLVGEIRDQETASIAVQAALTGHLVFSTLHTIDAASSITRLADIGIDSYKIAAALKGIVAQRLLRRLCPACRAPSPEPPPERLRRWIAPDAPLYRAAGCAQCASTGYRGRLAAVEILTTSREVERRISAHEPAERIARAARAHGMRSLWESGVAHALAGDTSVDEVLRVLDVPVEPGAHDADRPAAPSRRHARSHFRRP
ncbi:MAG: GspE/PulE family protein [Gemmatimonadaceae bacterium]